MKYARIGQLRVPAGASHPAAGGDSERLLDLERRGVLLRGKGRYPAGLKRGRPARVRGSVLADARAERDSGW